MNLQDLAKRERQLIVPIADEQVAMVYNPYKITGRFRDQHVTIAAFLAGCLISWDLQDGEDSVPLTAKDIQGQVPAIIRRLIFSAIGEDLYPKAWRAPQSGDSS